MSTVIAVKKQGRWIQVFNYDTELVDEEAQGFVHLEDGKINIEDITEDPLTQ